jgi:hypothetical protein
MYTHDKDLYEDEFTEAMDEAMVSEEFIDGVSDNPVPIDIASDITGLSYDELRKSSGYFKV